MHFPPASTSLTPASPRTAGRLRKLQSQPSLISQQRQQQLRNTSPARNPAIPSVPTIISTPRKHTRTRSNSDVVATSSSNTGPSPLRDLTSRTADEPKDELKLLIRRGPRGDLPIALQSLRHWILVDGLEADNDGMVRPYPEIVKPLPPTDMDWTVRSSHLHMVDIAQFPPPLDRRLPGAYPPRSITSIRQDSK